uniref:NMDA receptor synaptonuclear signaling and neuronal migration factor b n=1 Tax=Neogobius melanostomus TaxID=47308 RepID=A0A8C6WHX3_9GOBI
MGTAVSKRKNLKSDAISSVAAKVRAARAFSEYLSTAGPQNHNGTDHLLSDTFVVPDCDSPAISRLHNNNLPPPSRCLTKPNQTSQSLHQSTQISTLQNRVPVVGPSKRRLSAEHSALSEEQTAVAVAVPASREKPSRVYTITREGSMTLGGRGSEESLELEVLKTSRKHQPPRSGPHHRSSHHRSNHHQDNQHQSSSSSSSIGPSSQPLQSSGSAGNIRDWGLRRGGSREEYTPDCVTCIRAPCQSQRSLDLDISPRDGSKPRKKLERMYSEDRASSEDRDDGSNSWFPKENMFSFQTATTTMQSFSRSWSDPTPVKPESLHDSRDSGDLQTSTGTLDETLGQDEDWEEEREQERVACEGDDFIPPKIILISSKVPKAEYVPNIIRRDDPSIIPILYDHEHATFDDILEEVEKKLTAYRKGCRIWNMLIFCQGGPGHLYLLKNKVATFAKVEKEEDMIQFWRRLSRLMSKLNPEPNVIHIMGCYVLGSANEKRYLIQTLKRLMRPSAVEFKSPLELSAQGKEMIETYFDFRLFRLWKSRQHSKLLDYDDLL